MDPTDPDEHALVVLAICETCTGCLSWQFAAERRARRSKELLELTPEGIRLELQQYVRQNGGAVVEQRREQRPDYPAGFWYRVIIPYNILTHGLFVELVLVDDDPELPTVQIVNVHPQSK